MGSLQNPFLTAPVEESLAIKKGLLVNRPFLIQVSTQEPAQIPDHHSLLPNVCSVFALKPRNVFADYL
jgi:hypothetical protein